MTKANEKQRDSFIFYRSFFNAIKLVDIEQKAQIFDAICEYALDENQINLIGTSKALFELIRPQLDSNRAKFKNGCKEKKKSKTEAKWKQNGSKKKQTISKVEANVNVNEECIMLNDNENVNQNKNENEVERITDGLKFVLEAKLNKTLNTNSWSKEIRRLLEIDLGGRVNAIRDAENAINEISKRFGEVYFPVIHSAAAFREKFSKIEAAMRRKATNLSKMDQTVKNIMSFDQ